MLEPNKGNDAAKRFIPEFQILQPVLHDDSEKLLMVGWVMRKEAQATLLSTCWKTIYHDQML